MGSIDKAPQVDDNGIIYTCGQYGPVLTAISPEGEVLWKIESNDMNWYSDVAVIGNFIAVDTACEGIYIFDQYGHRINEPNTFSYNHISDLDYIFFESYNTIESAVLSYSDRLDGAYAEGYGYNLMNAYQKSGFDLLSVIETSALMNPQWHEQFAQFFVYSIEMESYRTEYYLDDLLSDLSVLNNLSTNQQLIVDKIIETIEKLG